MDLVAVVGSSVVVSTIVGSLAGYVTQRRLAERQAHIDYESAARRRLYEAIGPLRFQLLVAARDVVRRVAAHHVDAWDMVADGYYTRSFVYRLLRPLALLDLVQRQMNVADFSVDPAGRELLRFEAAAHRVLVDVDPLPYYDGLDWSTETQHVFRDNLRRAARRLVVADADGDERVIDYAEFAERYEDPSEDPALATIVSLFARCRRNLSENPVWWTRVVAYAYVNRWLLETQGRSLGFTDRPLDVQAALSATGDPQIRAHLADYPAILDRILAESL